MKTKAIIILLCMMLVAAIGISCRADVQMERFEYVVEPGDTLWDIATEHAPKGTDKREYIFNVKRDNGLKTSVLQPGMVLEIVREAE